MPRFPSPLEYLDGDVAGGHEGRVWLSADERREFDAIVERLDTGVSERAPDAAPTAETWALVGIGALVLSVVTLGNTATWVSFGWWIVALTASRSAISTERVRRIWLRMTRGGGKRT